MKNINDLILKRETLVDELEKTLTAAAELHAKSFDVLVALRRAAKDTGLTERNIPCEMDPGDFRTRVFEFFRLESTGLPGKSIVEQAAKEHCKLRSQLNRLEVH